MKQRVVFINFFILIGIILFAARFTSAWESFEQTHSLDQMVNSAQTEFRGAGQLGAEPMEPPPPFSDFIVISERNLFAEDRRPPSVEEEEEEPEAEIVEEEPPKWAGRPTLYGVSVVGGKRQAILTVFEGNPATQQLRTIHVGDLVQGYTVAEIGDTIVRLRWKDREEIIDVADAQGSTVEPRKGTVASVTVITVGSAPEAVQKTTTKAAGQQEGTGIEVSVVAGQANQAAGGQARRNQAPDQGVQRRPGR
ncbi:hypothetical protein MYX82_06055 [Acidobacteria bacterium AH-259-D05]|nr:hypothetical protein [Acidobacteria bacterium AH-259-D05]